MDPYRIVHTSSNKFIGTVRLADRDVPEFEELIREQGYQLHYAQEEI